MDSEDPGLAPLNGMMLDLRHAALEYLAKGSRVAEMVIAMLDASPEHLPAASVEPVALVRVINEALVYSHLDVADQADDYATAKRKLNNPLAHEQSIGAFFAAQSAPRLKWMEAPRRTEWGAGMMETLIALSADETLQLYAHRDAVPLVDALLSAQPAPARVPLTTDALKPCPFCGSDGVEALDMEGKHYVVCYDCALEGPFHKSRAAVIAAWNTRAATLA